MDASQYARLRAVVSILTRPWGRVQRQTQQLPSSRHLVSILTRPWGRVQRVRRGRAQGRSAFQSSPARGGGCNLSSRFVSVVRGNRFNPHPPVGAGAAGCGRSKCWIQCVFQSSPARGGGCNQHSHSQEIPPWQSFQSSPARGGGCNRCWAGWQTTSCCGFNPHPPVGAGATLLGNPCGETPPAPVSILTRPWGRVQRFGSADGFLAPQRFQSSPARGGGCNRVTVAENAPEPIVSILTRPWGRVQHAVAARLAWTRPVSILTRPWGRVQRGLENARERFPKRKCSSCQGVPCRALGG